MPNSQSEMELQSQQDFVDQVREIMAVRATHQPPLAHVWTYGCQQNVADSQKIKGMLQEMGFDFTDSPDEADFILFNTCAVREHAEDRVFGNVGALKHIKNRRPSTIIALCGCMMQQPQVADRIRKSFPYVSMVFGTHVIHRFPELLFEALTGGKRVFELPDRQGEIVEGLPVVRESNFKAWLPIMYGCDNFCSYCIVPYVRGRERSRSPEAVVNEAKELVKAGYKDITLLGQNVNSYGKGLPEQINFAGLLERINQIPGDFRIRFMTSHPKDATHELIDTMSRCDKVARHLHLPFQSGNDQILKAMNRRYTRQQYLDLVAYVKKKIPDICLTSDIIVGFPGETYEQFLDTLDLVRQVEFSSLYTFIYSPREGTPAAKLPDPIPHEEKAKWLNELLKVQEGIAAKRSAAMVGRTVRVLCEEMGKNGELCGRTSGNIIVGFPGKSEMIGRFAQVHVTSSLNWILKGELVELED